MELLQRFFRYVHIYNPILEVEKVQDYARNLAFNGLAWDNKSCLLVSFFQGWLYTYTVTRQLLTPAAPDICFGDYLGPFFKSRTCKFIHRTSSI